ncbi:MAG: hypothetical protein HC880_01300 [Bacteroidia bacterium]|nr:hypothetical protein [Bacteroidia bacterium]
MYQTSTNLSELHADLIARFGNLEKHVKETMLPIRQEAIDNFYRFGFPSIKHEEWKYTNISKIFKHRYDFNPISPLKAEDIQSYRMPGLEAHVFVMVNGRYQPELSTRLPGDEALEVLDFMEAVQTHNDLVYPHLAQHLMNRADTFTALNTAFAERGLFLYLPDNQTLKYPILQVFISDARENPVALQPRNLFIFGKNTEATFIDEIIAWAINPALIMWSAKSSWEKMPGSDTIKFKMITPRATTSVPPRYINRPEVLTTI